MHTSALKPDLSVELERQGLLYCLSFIQYSPTRTLKFMDMYRDVHVDEKWFFLTKKQHKYILTEGETDPHRTINQKSHVDKVMFLCAQARPRKDYARNKSWDGKIGLWLIGEYTHYVKHTKNHTVSLEILSGPTRTWTVNCTVSIWVRLSVALRRSGLIPNRMTRNTIFGSNRMEHEFTPVICFGWCGTSCCTT
jgi:hypothetical protein